MLTLMLYSSAVSAVIGLGVWLVERFVSGRKRATRWLWSAALGAMVVVTVLPASRVADSDTRTDSAPAASIPPAGVQSQAAPESRPFPPAGMTTAPRAVTSDVVVLGVWITLSALGLLILAGSAFRIARMQRGWRPAEIAGVPVMLSHDVGPAIVGLFHHGVVMPAWVEALPPVQQLLIVTHEREHLRAGDPLLLWSATFLVVLFPWNLAMWLALRGLRHAIEIDCDARVLKSQPDTREYCSLLLDVGERTLAGVAPLAALAEPSTLLERRVDVMTSRLGTSAKSALALAAGVALLVVGCVAPRTSLAPRRDALSMVQELSGLLRSDSVVATIPQADRDALAARLSPPKDSTTDYGVAKRTTDEWETLLVPSIDSAIAQFYPELATRTDRTQKLVILNYTDEGRLATHEVMNLADARNAKPPIEDLDIVAPDFLSRHSHRGTHQVVIHHERPKLHADVLVRVKRGPVRRVSVPPRPAHDEIDTDSAPPALQFSRRVDSLARADYPVAFQPHEDAYVVAVLFRKNGEVVGKTGKQFPVAQVFDTIPGGRNLGARDSGYLMSLMNLGDQQLGSSGMSFTSTRPHTVFVWGMIAEW